jgi:hypothetical protein
MAEKGFDNEQVLLEKKTPVKVEVLVRGGGGGRGGMVASLQPQGDVES